MDKIVVVVAYCQGCATRSVSILLNDSDSVLLMAVSPVCCSNGFTTLRTFDFHGLWWVERL